jgi:hypothetical protein
MHWDSKILINYPFKIGHLSHEAKLQMHWDGWSLSHKRKTLFYYLNAFEIWPYKMGGLCWVG